MKRKTLIGKAFAVVMALSVIFAYSVVAFADGSTGTKYEPNKTYILTEAEKEALPEYEGFTWSITEHTAAYHDTSKELICGKEEHQHGDACYSYTFTCSEKEHTHGDGNCVYCKFPERHLHLGFNCEYHFGDKKFGCIIPYNHYHSASCCSVPEHTHSDQYGSCYTRSVICKEEEHAHTDACYPLVPATYSAILLEDGSDKAENGSKVIKIHVTLKCPNGKPAAGVKVKLTAKDITEFDAETPVLTREATTNGSGKVEFNISNTYDSVTIEAADQTFTTNEKVGKWALDKSLYNRYNPSFEYALKEHLWRVESFKAATCFNTGSKEYICNACGEDKTETIDKLNHALVTVDAKPATCEEAGHKAGKRCTNEGCTYTEGMETIGKLGHDLKTVEALAATCETKGHKEGKVCQRAGCTYTEGMEEIPALGHKYDDGVVIKEPTYTEKGIKKYTCKNDPTHTYVEDIDKLEGEIITPGPGGDGEIIPPGSGGDGGIITPPIPNPGPSGDTDPVVPGTPDTPDDPGQVDPSGDSEPADDGNIDAEPEGDAAETADTDAEDSEAKGVKTGDETMLAMWGALGLIAALGLGGTLVIGRRREE